VFALPNRGYTESIRHLALTAAKQSATISLTLAITWPQGFLGEE
jgi:hypothetical protein